MQNRNLEVDGTAMAAELVNDSVVVDLPEGVNEVILTAYPSSMFAFTIGDSTVSEITDTMDVEVHVMAENWKAKIYTVVINPFEDDPAVGQTSPCAKDLQRQRLEGKVCLPFSHHVVDAGVLLVAHASPSL